MISRSIQQESQVFIAKIIHEDSFRNTKSIRSIEFSEDPKLYVIENNAFMHSTLKSSERWCGRLSIFEIEIKEKNQRLLILKINKSLFE